MEELRKELQELKLKVDRYELANLRRSLRTKQLRREMMDSIHMPGFDYCKLCKEYAEDLIRIDSGLPVAPFILTDVEREELRKELQELKHSISHFNKDTEQTREDYANCDTKICYAAFLAGIPFEEYDTYNDMVKRVSDIEKILKEE